MRSSHHCQTALKVDGVRAVDWPILCALNVVINHGVCALRRQLKLEIGQERSTEMTDLMRGRRFRGQR